MDSNQFFAELTAAIDAGIEADQLAGVLENIPVNGPCASWRAAARKCWAAWELAQKLAEDAYDRSAQALDDAKETELETTNTDDSGVAAGGGDAAPAVR
jgi:hypothetical protein